VGHTPPAPAQVLYALCKRSLRSGCTCRAVLHLLECSELEVDPVCFYTEEVLDRNTDKYFSLWGQIYMELPVSVLEEELLKPLPVSGC